LTNGLFKLFEFLLNTGNIDFSSSRDLLDDLFDLFKLLFVLLNVIIELLNLLLQLLKVILVNASFIRA